MVFTLIPAAFVMAGGEQEKKPFPAAQKPPPEEGDVYFVSEVPPADEEDIFLIPETDDFKKDEPVSAPQMSYKEENKGIDKYPQSSHETNAAVAAQPAHAAVPPPPSPQPAPPQPVQPQPAPVQPQTAPSRAPPQPPVRTGAPTVNIIVPSVAPPVAAPPAQPASPPAYRPTSIKVVPGMPDACGDGVYRVQLGAFSNTVNAQQCFDRLKSADFTPYYEQYGSLYRVVITGIQAADMVSVIRRLEAAGFREAWIREER